LHWRVYRCAPPYLALKFSFLPYTYPTLTQQGHSPTWHTHQNSFALIFLIHFRSYSIYLG
jgi:hypothetical protein